MEESSIVNIKNGFNRYLVEKTEFNIMVIQNKTIGTDIRKYILYISFEVTAVKTFV
tara:strand:+ start:11528 stop:11695 length:168 start_codon:yes stop_codon:yes gene_type:complete